MGSERTQIIPKTRPFETFKMFSRLLYGVFIWYEFIFKPMDYTVNKMVVTS